MSLLKATTSRVRTLLVRASLVLQSPFGQKDLFLCYRKGALISTTCQDPGPAVSWYNGNDLFQEVSETEANTLCSCDLPVYSVTGYENKTFTYFGYVIKINKDDCEFIPDKEELWGMILRISDGELKLNKT